MSGDAWKEGGIDATGKACFYLCIFYHVFPLKKNEAKNIDACDNLHICVCLLHK